MLALWETRCNSGTETTGNTSTVFCWQYRQEYKVGNEKWALRHFLLENRMEENINCVTIKGIRPWSDLTFWKKYSVGEGKYLWNSFYFHIPYGQTVQMEIYYLQRWIKQKTGERTCNECLWGSWTLLEKLICVKTAVDVKHPRVGAKSTHLVHDELRVRDPPWQAKQHLLSSNFHSNGRSSEPQISNSDPHDRFLKTNFNSVLQRWPICSSVSHSLPNPAFL